MSYWKRIGGENAITFQAWLILAPISIFLTAGFVPEGTTGTYILWTLVGLIAHLVTGVVLLVARYTYLHNRPRKSRPLLAIGTFAVAGLLRGASVSYSSELFGLVEAAEYLLRMRSGAVILIFWFSLAAVVIDSSRKYRQAAQQISDKVLENDQLEKQTHLQVRQYRDQIIQEVEDIIAQAFARANTASQLNQVISQVVRPLSHELYNRNQYPDVQAAINLAKKPKLRIGTAPIIRSMFGRTPFNPITVSVVAVGGTAASRLWTAPLANFVADVLLNLIWIYGVLAIANKVTQKSVRLRTVSSVPVWLAAGIGSGLITELTTSGTFLASASATLLLSVNVVAVALFAAIFFAFDYERERKLDELAKVLTKSNWLVAKTKQALWSERRRLARLVHSQVQARILATSARIVQSGKALTSSDLQQLHYECHSAMLATERPESIAEFLDATREIWEGAVAIQGEPSAEVKELLEVDSTAALATLEVMREAINNAVKHSEAKTITVSFQAERPSSGQIGFLNLKVENDGVGKKRQTESGLGSKILDEVTSSWSFKSKDDKAVLNAKIPIRLASV